MLQKSGTGRLYYRLGLRYAPSSLAVDARDEGFVVDRRYEAVNDPGDVQPRRRRRVAHQARRDGSSAADDGRRYQSHQHGARRRAPGRARGAQSGTRRVAASAGREAFRRRRREPTSDLVRLHLVRPRESPRRPGRSVQRLSLRRDVRLHVCRTRDDARRVRRASGATRRRSTRRRCSDARAAIASSSAEPEEPNDVCSLPRLEESFELELAVA